MKPGTKEMGRGSKAEKYARSEQGKPFSFLKEWSLAWTNDPIYKTALNFYNNLQNPSPPLSLKGATVASSPDVSE